MRTNDVHIENVSHFLVHLLICGMLGGDTLRRQPDIMESFRTAVMGVLLIVEILWAAAIYVAMTHKDEF